MIKSVFKVFLIIFGLFILDLVKPFGYSLSVEFVFLGFVIVALTQPLPIAFFGALFAAYFRDFFISSGFSLSWLEFPLLCVAIRYIRLHRIFLDRQRYFFIARGVLAGFCLLVHSLVNSLTSGLTGPIFLLQFFIQSLCLYYLMDYLLQLKAGPDHSF
ncbi:MAG: hypothetical protein KKG91_03260 [Candidatus Omnitrophica bacterium]|nr:hypothetical protein [Candidatus Omnitrophota bacterium]